MRRGGAQWDGVASIQIGAVAGDGGSRGAAVGSLGRRIGDRAVQIGWGLAGGSGQVEVGDWVRADCEERGGGCGIGGSWSA